MKYALIALLFLTSCSPNWFCKKCLSTGTVKSDTTVVADTLKIPIAESVADTTVRIKGLTVKEIDLFDDLVSKLGGPIIVENAHVKAQVSFRPGAEIDVKATRKPDTVREVQKKYYYVTKKISTGYTLWQMIAVGLACFGLGVLVLLLKR